MSIKQTLLEMDQEILAAMSSDEVNSISDTPESLQVAQIIKRKYYDIISRGDLPEHNQMFQLDPSLDPIQPVMMHIPEGVSHVEWIKYFDSNVLNTSTGNSHGVNTNIVATTPWTTTSTSSVTIGVGTQTFTLATTVAALTGQTVKITSGVNSMTGAVTSYIGNTLVVNITAFTGSGTFTSWIITATSTVIAPPGYQYVTMLPIRQFVDMVNTFNPTESNVQSFTFSDTSNGYPGTFTFYYKTDRQPKYCTVISNYYVIFDSYDITQDDTLQASKCMGFGQVVPVFTMVDNFIPDLDAQQFPLLVNEAKALAFYELKQQPHEMAIQEVKRQWSTVQKNKNINNRPTAFDALSDFGRHGRGFRSQTSLFKDRGWDN